MPVYVSNEQDKVYVGKDLIKHLEKLGFFVLDGQGLGVREAGIILVDDEEIRRLNKEYRGIDSPTDVLSFALNEGEEVEGADFLLGDVYISMERAVAQAEEYGHSLLREVSFLAVHGLLHLLGYDHQTEEERQRMRQKEEEILEEFGLPR
ncbi:MAG: putative rRNA maturation factor [Eubacteriales bacterium]|nr:putative rRNA maturation factor [Eubacteriales bacterium]